MNVSARYRFRERISSTELLGVAMGRGLVTTSWYIRIFSRPPCYSPLSRAFCVYLVGFRNYPTSGVSPKLSPGFSKPGLLRYRLTDVTTIGFLLHQNQTK